ncbi:MAG: 50S ribosomal protein L16 [Candidatus Diapherotrites archaeon]|nr:50S ribosomal protein L16 [Candidatus Diapherotrites archaeon]
MGLRPGHCYSSIKHRPYTRVAITVHEKNYIGTVPPVRIRQFNMGNPSMPYTHIIDLIADDAVQIRDNAIEALRISINRFLIRNVGKENYFMRIRVFPHQILREHKQAQGAGADRVSQGMSHAFGKPIGRAIRVKKGTIVLSILALPQHVNLIEKTLEKRAKSKLPCSLKVKTHTDLKSIGTLPRKAIIEEKIEEAKPEEEKAAEEKAAEATEKIEGKEDSKKEDKGEAKKSEKTSEKKPEKK